MHTAPDPVPEPDPLDQVLRLKAFREKHPEFDIRAPHAIVSGSWRAYRDGWLKSQAFCLSWILDDLDRLVTEGDDGWIYEAQVIPLFPASVVVGDDGGAAL